MNTWALERDGQSQWRNRLPRVKGVSRLSFWREGEGVRRMKKRIALLLTALMLALSMSFGVAGGAFASKTTTFDKRVCMTKAGQGGGSGTIKEQHHGSCNSNGADF